MPRAHAHGKAPGWPVSVGLLLVRFVLVLVTVAVVAFALVKLSPIDPVTAYLGPNVATVGAEQRALIAERWGVDRPAPEQFALWLRNLAGGDLGHSLVYNAPVADVLAQRARAALVLMGLAWLFSGALGFALGLVAGTYEGSWADRIIRTYAYLTASTPTFWLAIVLIMVFSVGLGWTPVCCAAPAGIDPADVGLWDRARHLALPLVTLSILGLAPVILHTRAKMVEIMHSDYAVFARAQGAGPLDIALRHGARNAALPAITIMFASLGELFGGSVLAEQVFAYPGLGRATIEAGLRGDVPLLLAITLVMTALVSLGNMIADLLYRVFDPRMREDGAREPAR